MHLGILHQHNDNGVKIYFDNEEGTFLNNTYSRRLEKDGNPGRCLHY